MGQDFDAWGLDHGTWSVLAHMFPAADVPVVQLSINATKPWDYHLELGARLAPLRRQGVLIVGSGNVVHNLRKVRPAMAEVGFDWARRFDEDARTVMLDDPTEVAALTGHADFAAAVPTPDHFIPLLYLAGLAGDASRTAGRARRRLRRRLAVDDRLHPRRRLPAGGRRRRRCGGPAGRPRPRGHQRLTPDSPAVSTFTVAPEQTVSHSSTVTIHDHSHK